MDNIRAAMKKSPAAIVLQTLRTALVLPQAAANAFIGEMTKPNEAQKAWIKKIDNSFWKGSLIAPNINCDSDAQAIRRLRKADLIIFEVHGGGFRVGSSTMYMPAFVSWITILKLKHGLDAVMMSVDYGLAPKHKYPEPVYDVLNAYRHLTEDLHVPGWKIIMSSDSAGSAVTLETLIRTYAPGIIDDPEAPRSNRKVHLPAGMVLSSPLVTPETNSWSWEHLEKHDMVSQHLAKLVFKEFLNYPHVNPDDLPILRLSGINHGYNRFAPKNALVFVGDKEVMRDDIMHLLDTVKADGWTKVRVCKEKYAHDWFLIREIVKKKDKMMLCQYDEVFADFAAYAVAEAAEQLSKDDNKQAEATTTKSAQAQVDVNLQAENIVETVNDILTADEKGAVVSHIENVDNNRPGLIVP